MISRLFTAFCISPVYLCTPRSDCHFVTSPLFVYTQPIPFAGTILGGLVPGEMILIQGGVPVDSERYVGLEVLLICLIELLWGTEGTL